MPNLSDNESKNKEAANYDATATYSSNGPPSLLGSRPVSFSFFESTPSLLDGSGSVFLGVSTTVDERVSCFGFDVLLSSLASNPVGKSTDTTSGTTGEATRSTESAYGVPSSWKTYCE